MGWDADTSWDLEFHSFAARDAAFKIIAADADFDIDASAKPEDLPAALIGRFNEDSEAWFPEDNPLAINGWGSGKCYLDGADLEILAPYATGTVDMKDHQDHWRYRLRNGKVTSHNGVIVYPDDPYDEAPPKIEVDPEAEKEAIESILQATERSPHEDQAAAEAGNDGR